MTEARWDLNFPEDDILSEIGNIGCSNALTSLAMFTSADFAISVPQIGVIDYERLPNIIAEPEDLCAGVALDITGDINGMFMYITEQALTDAILMKLGLPPSGKDLRLDEIQESALLEVGNIMCNSYLKAIADFVDIDMRVSVPTMAADMLGAILELPMLRFASSDSKLLYIKSTFTIDGQNYSGDMILMPELTSVYTLLKKLGVR